MTLDPADDDGLGMSAAHTMFPGGGLRRSQRPWFHRWEPLCRALGWIALIPMCLTVGRHLRGFWSHRLGPLYIVLGGIVLIFVYLTVFWNCWHLYVIPEEGLPVAGDVALPEMSPAVFAGAAAVPVSLPAVAGVVSSAVFAGGGGGRC